MKKLPFILLCGLVLIVTLIGAAAQAERMSQRAALAAVMPIVVEVLTALETERGLPFPDEEISAILRTEEFQKRLLEAIQESPMYQPCRIDECRQA